MKRIVIGTSMTLFSWAGWWLGAKVGFQTALILSTLGTILGVYIGWRIYHDHLDF